MGTYAVCSSLVREAAEEGGAYYSGVLARFIIRSDLKVALDDDGNRVLTCYRREAEKSSLGRKNIMDWLRLLAARPQHNFDKISVDAQAIDGKPLFVFLTGSIVGDKRLLCWSKQHYGFVQDNMPDVRILDRDEAVKELADPVAISEGGLTVVHNYGDHFGDVSGTIINRSQVADAFNVLNERDGAEIAKAMVDLAAVVSGLGSPPAEAIYESFRRESTKPERDKGVIKKLWDGLSPMIEATGKVAELSAKLLPLWT